MTSLPDLLARVEGATGADREIDSLLWYKLIFDPELAKPGYGWMKTPGIGHSAPAFTASLDQALALCSRVLPGWHVQVETHPPCKPNPLGLADATVWESDLDRPYYMASLPTAPLSLLAAMLDALIAQEDVKPFVCEGNGSACTDSGSTAVEPKSDGPCKSEGAR